MSNILITGANEGIGYYMAEELLKRIMSRRFVICHSLAQKIQTMGCYLFPLKVGGLMSKMSEGYSDGSKQPGAPTLSHNPGTPLSLWPPFETDTFRCRG